MPKHRGNGRGMRQEIVMVRSRRTGRYLGGHAKSRFGKRR